MKWEDISVNNIYWTFLYRKEENQIVLNMSPILVFEKTEKDCSYYELIKNPTTKKYIKNTAVEPFKILKNDENINFFTSKGDIICFYIEGMNQNIKQKQTEIEELIKNKVIIENELKVATEKIEIEDGEK